MKLRQLISLLESVRTLVGDDDVPVSLAVKYRDDDEQQTTWVESDLQYVSWEVGPDWRAVILRAHPDKDGAA